MEELIKETIEELRPYLNSDGGDIEFVELKDDTVYIRLSGACSGCDHRNTTIQNMVLTMIQENAPQIKAVKEK